MNRISRKSFIPAAFFSLGIECLYDDHVRPHIWAWVLSKADAYTESTAALDRVRHNTRAKRQNVQKITGENAQEK